MDNNEYKNFDTDDIDIKGMDFDNDSFLDNKDEPFDINTQLSLTPVSSISSENTSINIITNQSNNPIINADPNSFIVLNILDSDKKLPELIKLTNNLKPNEDLDETKVEESKSKELSMPKLEYTSQPDLESDFQLARRNLIELTKQGTSVVEDIVALARSTEHPNTYKALNETLATFAQLNKDLLEIYRTKIEIEKKVAEAGGITSNSSNGQVNQSNVQNNVFIGTTDELLAKIANAGLNQLDNMLVSVKEEDESK